MARLARGDPPAPHLEMHACMPRVCTGARVIRDAHLKPRHRRLAPTTESRQTTRVGRCHVVCACCVTARTGVVGGRSGGDFDAAHLEPHANAEQAGRLVDNGAGERRTMHDRRSEQGIRDVVQSLLAGELACPTELDACSQDEHAKWILIGRSAGPHPLSQKSPGHTVCTPPERRSISNQHLQLRSSG
jgi:hypothetical protein